VLLNSTEEETMTDIVLIGGLWLRPEIWTDVVREVKARGHHALPVALPGQGDDVVDVGLEDQVGAVLAVIDACATPPVVVGHSAAATLAWIAADRRPVAQVVLIGGFPSTDGEAYANFLPITDGAMPFPGWEAFEGPDSADLDVPTREHLAAAMVPVPEGIARGIVHLSNEDRFDVPVTEVCPEFTPEDARAWIAAGDSPELARARHLDFVDLDSGHWPMVTQPVALARSLVEIAVA
jgi:pimeloyl-ACP methyl ester carboxylesterase